MERMEKKVLENSTHVFVTPEIYESRKYLYENAVYKTSVLPYIIGDLTLKDVPRDIIRMTYAGRFYSDIRPAEPLLDFFMLLKIDNLVLDLFSEGECEDVVRKYAEKSKGKIRLNSMVRHEQLVNEYANSDILINMENNVKEYKPSKQYEYIGTGKPIISFYYFEPDAELSKYPLALQINIKRLQDDIEQAREFISGMAGKKMNYKEITEIYKNNSIESVVSMIKDCIRDDDLYS